MLKDKGLKVDETQALDAEKIDKNKRMFLALLGTAGALWAVSATLFPVLKYLGFRSEADVFDKKTGRARVDKILASDVAKPGSGKNGSYGNRGLILFRDEGGALKAFDSKCTHAGCNVVFEGTRIFCNCHGGTYDLNGKNIAGPPPRPLTPLQVAEENGVLYVSKYKP